MDASIIHGRENNIITGDRGREARDLNEGDVSVRMFTDALRSVCSCILMII